MQKFLLRRVGLALLALFALSILTFSLVRTGHYQGQYSYSYSDYYWYSEKPSLALQYGRYVNDLFGDNLEMAWGLENGWRLNDGWNYGWEANSGNIVLERLADTLKLASLALAISAILGISLGVATAMNRDSPFDRWASTAISLGRSLPVFWLGVIVVGVAAYLPGGLPVSYGAGLKYLILPAITLALLPAAVIAKLVRSAMMTALESDYVKLARMKGLMEWKIIWKHCLRNVAVSPMLSFGLIGGSFMTALVLTEATFDWPGAGHLVLQTIHGNGYHPVLSGVVLVLAGGFILCHLIYDVLRAFLDPRIRYSEGTSFRHDTPALVSHTALGADEFAGR